MEAQHAGYYTVAELAKVAGCRAQMVYNYIHRGRLPFVYDTGRYLVPRSEGDLWAKHLQEWRDRNGAHAE